MIKKEIVIPYDYYKDFYIIQFKSVNHYYITINKNDLPMYITYDFTDIQKLIWSYYEETYNKKYLHKNRSNDLPYKIEIIYGIYEYYKNDKLYKYNGRANYKYNFIKGICVKLLKEELND